MYAILCTAVHVKRHTQSLSQSALGQEMFVNWQKCNVNPKLFWAMLQMSNISIVYEYEFRKLLQTPLPFYFR